MGILDALVPGGLCLNLRCVPILECALESTCCAMDLIYHAAQFAVQNGTLLEGGSTAVGLVQMEPGSSFGSEGDRHRYETLLQMADLMARPYDLDGLLREVSHRLSKAVDFNLIVYALHDPGSDRMMFHCWQSNRSNELIAFEHPATGVPCGLAWQTQQPLLIRDVDQETRFPEAVAGMRGANVKTYCAVPLTTATRRLGAMGVGCEHSHCAESDVDFIQRVAELVALAVENALNSRALKEERERLQLLLVVSNALLSNVELPDLFPVISGSIRRIIHQDYASLFLHDEETQTLRRYAEDSDADPAIPPVLPVKGSVVGSAFLEREAKLYGPHELAAARTDASGLNGIHSLCSLPLVTPAGPVGTLNFASKQDSAFTVQNVSLLKQIAAQVALALDNARAYREIAALKDKLAEEKVYLQGEIRSELNFEEIIGESSALKRVLEAAKVVAPSDAAALLLGDTGTGKELIARAIHRLSQRKDAPFIKLNCAAIPTGLLESELFGHEKGAFTGAISQKIGRLELADKGTLFLDEVGDIPIELQPKLLRVLQDQEFERLGGTRTIRVNIRLIAATNRDLAAAVAAKQFRSDLYYRLKVFPIHIPPLRERREDIPLLVRYFVQKLSRRMNRKIETVPEEVLQALCNWSWPGNIRELENFIERSVILSRGSVLNVPLAELLLPGESGLAESHTLENLEREYILRVLRETGGVIGGTKGAANRLGLKRTTLQSRMQKMGIAREDFSSEH